MIDAVAAHFAYGQVTETVRRAILTETLLFPGRNSSFPSRVDRQFPVQKRWQARTFRRGWTYPVAPWTESSIFILCEVLQREGDHIVAVKTTQEEELVVPRYFCAW